jgi:hypothetical protein
MLDWLGAPTWHFARSILNAGAGHSNSRSGGSISRSTNLAGSERDRGWGAMQNCYPIAMEPLDMRNERGFDGLGRVGGIGRERGVWSPSASGPAGVAWEERGLVAMLQGV